MNPYLIIGLLAIMILIGALAWLDLIAHERRDRGSVARWDRDDAIGGGE